MSNPRIHRAIISVSNKLGLPAFARGLVEAGVDLYSTGGTRRVLEDEGVPVRDIADYTGFPEMMDGRLKTLHPKIFGGILCRRDRTDDMTALDDHGILPFELIVVNLYPFEATIAREGVTDAEAIEQIDIGGPSLVRAAAKNHAFATIVTQPTQYEEVLEQVRKDGCTTLEQRRRLAGEAFARTAAYDRAIANYFARDAGVDFPSVVTLSFERQAELRYGENPHQNAAVYRDPGAKGANIVGARQLHGKELSYNNLLDLDSALAIVRMFAEPAAAVIKHNNPCGAAVGATLAEAGQKALEGDPLSAFGSILAFNQAVDAQTAELLATPGLFIEAMAAPAFSAEALEILTTRPKWRQNVRLMAVGELEQPAARQFRPLEGGLLVQDADIQPDPESEWKVVTERQPTSAQLDELRFAWSLVRHIKSNAIAVCNQRALCGAGAGQMSRVDAVDIALAKSGDRAAGAVLASDAFFPFPDSIDKAAQARIAAVIQPGGSKNDGEVVAACNRHGIAMIFTGRRHFKH